MKSKYLHHLELASSIRNNTEKLVYLMSVLRSLLQTTVIITFELTKKETSYDEIGLLELIDRFKKPADGLPLEVFTHLIPILRTYINNAFLQGWFETTKEIRIPLKEQLQEWVTFRNSIPGHGVLDKPRADAWSAKTENIINDCLIVFKSILLIDSSDTEKLSKEFKGLEVTIPLTYDDNIFVIKNISSKRGIWRLKGQLVSLSDAKEFIVDLSENNVFSTKGLESYEKYPHDSFLLASSKKVWVNQNRLQYPSI